MSVFVRGPAVYICARDKRESTRRNPTPSEIHCPVCRKAIAPKRRVLKQYICAGTKKKSKCQIWRYKREHGVSIEERSIATAGGNG